MRFRVHSGESARVQRGFAVIALLALAALIAAFLIASGLNLTSAGISNEREDRSMNALRKAKAALIAYAASEQWQLYKALPALPPVAYFQPGALPCPDQDDDGDADCFGSLTASMIGRVPFKTLGIEDLRDASGERLWYALSHDFRKMQCPGTGCTTINSDTQGQLSVIGIAPASQVVAIVFAPGEAIQGQTRDPTNASVHNDPLNYLEGPPDLSSVNYVFTTALPSNTFNDRVLVIMQADLMAAVEPVVAARIERDIKPYITQNYSSTNVWVWGGEYPFAVPWGGGPGQPQDNYKGDPTTIPPTSRGLMPVTREPGWVAWDPASVSVIDYDALDTGSSDITSVNCGTSTSSQIECVVNYSGSTCTDRPGIRLRATLRNAGKSFVNPASESNTSITDSGGSPVGWSPSLTPNNPSQITNTLLANGDATVTFYGRLTRACSTSRPVTIRVAVPSYHPISDSADTTSGWFIANQWYRQIYYAVSQGYVPGGGSSCNLRPLPPAPPTSPSCLRINNLPSSYANLGDKQVILVFAGRALNGTPRPSGNLANYLEGENSTPADLIFEHRSGAPTSINDRVVVVSP